MKNIKMRPPVPLFNLFKKSSMMLYLFLKPKSRAKAYIIKTVVWCLRDRKDVKKTVQKKIGKSFFRINLFYFLFEFQTGPTYALLLFVICFYLWFVRSSH